jgi:hypothetical protein
LNLLSPAIDPGVSKDLARTAGRYRPVARTLAGKKHPSANGDDDPAGAPPLRIEVRTGAHLRFLKADCAAANLAMGTRKGLQLT